MRIKNIAVMALLMLNTQAMQLDKYKMNAVESSSQALMFLEYANKFCQTRQLVQQVSDSADNLVQFYKNQGLA